MTTKPLADKSLLERQIDRARDILNDEPSLNGADLNALATKVVAEGIENREAITARAQELHAAPPKAEAPKTGEVVVKGQQGGKVGRPDSIPPAIWATLTAAERLAISNDILAGRAPTVPHDAADRAKAPKPERRIEFPTQAIELAQTGKIELRKVSITKPTPHQKLAAANDAVEKKGKGARKET